MAIITGAGRGIGRATAVELARRGYGLALASRSVGEIEQTIRLAEQAIGAGPRSEPETRHPYFVALPTDVTRSGEVDRLIGSTIDRFGRIDAVVHCAGLAPVRPIAQMGDDEWREVIDTNLSAGFYLCRAAWPAFEKQGGGAVVLVSSAAARDPFPGFAAYGAAKAGLNLFALSAAREGAPIGVRVHVVAPGAVETAMFRKIATPEQWPADKTLDPADVAGVIAQCVASDLRYTSGEVIWMKRSH